SYVSVHTPITSYHDSPSLHDALPISFRRTRHRPSAASSTDYGRSRRNTLTHPSLTRRVPPLPQCGRGCRRRSLRRVRALPHQHRSEEHTSELQSPYDLV